VWLQNIDCKDLVCKFFGMNILQRAVRPKRYTFADYRRNDGHGCCCFENLLLNGKTAGQRGSFKFSFYFNFIRLRVINFNYFSSAFVFCFVRVAAFSTIAGA
jgi:hypothetical protein